MIIGVGRARQISFPFDQMIGCISVLDLSIHLCVCETAQIALLLEQSKGHGFPGFSIYTLYCKNMPLSVSR